MLMGTFSIYIYIYEVYNKTKIEQRMKAQVTRRPAATM